MQIKIGEKVAVFHSSDKSMLYDDQASSLLESRKTPHMDTVAAVYQDNWIKTASGDLWPVSRVAHVQVRGKNLSNILRTVKHGRR